MANAAATSISYAFTVAREKTCPACDVAIRLVCWWLVGEQPTTVPPASYRTLTPSLAIAHRTREVSALGDAPRVELVNFRLKVRFAAQDTYGASAKWLDVANDDLLLAAAFAV